MVAGSGVGVHNGWVVRPEAPDDVAGVQQVLAAAFGRPDEADLVAALRDDPAWVSDFSFVAVAGPQVVGHTLLTRLTVGGAPALALAPVAVLPERQGEGIGTAMVRAGLDVAGRRGERLVVVLGDPVYYARFGFVPARTLRVTGPFESAGDAFGALVLGNPAKAPTGRAVYAAAFGLGHG
jgi:predicted N-acetyltransferase YhbS